MGDRYMFLTFGLWLEERLNTTLFCSLFSLLSSQSVLDYYYSASFFLLFFIFLVFFFLFFSGTLYSVWGG